PGQHAVPKPSRRHIRNGAINLHPFLLERLVSAAYAKHIPGATLDRDALDDGISRIGGDDVGQAESGLQTQAVELAGIAFAASKHDEHHEIRKLGRIRFVRAFEDLFHEKKPATVVDRRPTLAED